MLRVALTGGVGSGKSTAAQRLRELGAHLSQSDEVARAMMQPGQPAFTALVAHFGGTILLPTGELDRAALARIAFQDDRVEEVNGLVHPLVLAEQAAWTSGVEAADPAAVAVVESALVFETRHAGNSPWSTRFDRVVVVTAPVELRRQRCVARGLSADDFDRRAAVQWPDEQKAALADCVLRNDGEMGHLIQQVDSLWSTLIAESEERAAEAM